MAYVLDGVILLILGLAIFFGYKNGFVKSVLRLAGCVIALLLAWMLSGVAAEGIFDTFASEPIKESISSQAESLTEEETLQGIQEVFENLPESLRNALEAGGFSTPDEIFESVQGSLDGTAETLSETIVAKVIRPVAVALLRGVCFFALFVLLLVAAMILVNVISKVFKLPLLRQMNGLLGGVVGALQGILFLFVAVTIIQVIADSSSADALITQKDIDQSFLVSWMSDINPLAGSVESVLTQLPDQSS